MIKNRQESVYKQIDYENDYDYEHEHECWSLTPCLIPFDLDTAGGGILDV